MVTVNVLTMLDTIVLLFFGVDFKEDAIFAYTCMFLTAEGSLKSRSDTAHRSLPCLI